MNVLSLFDGISCGLLALERAGVKVDNYYASEIDKHAIIISKKNHPEIIHLGDALNTDTQHKHVVMMKGRSMGGKNIILPGYIHYKNFKNVQLLKLTKWQKFKLWWVKKLTSIV